MLHNFASGAKKFDWVNMKNYIGFSSHGTSNVCGKNNSVLPRLREINDNIVFIKCTCHSLALCCEYAR